MEGDDFLDFGELEERAKRAETVAVICNADTAFMVPETQEAIQKANASATVRILEPADIACRHKTPRYDLHVLLTLECPFHSFENAVLLKRRCTLVISGDDAVFDSRFPHAARNVSENAYAGRVRVVVSDCQRFYDYFFYVSGATSFSSAAREGDRVRFLVSRLALVDRVRGRRTFGIFFSSPEYRALAEKVSKFLEDRGKETLLVFVRDISWERLVAIEFAEVFVVVDCPFYTHFEIKTHVPLVTPFEVALSFKETWDGEYGINEFETAGLSAEEKAVSSVEGCTEMVLCRGTYHNRGKQQVLAGLICTALAATIVLETFHLWKKGLVFALFPELSLFLAHVMAALCAVYAVFGLIVLNHYNQVELRQRIDKFGVETKLDVLSLLVAIDLVLSVVVSVNSTTKLLHFWARLRHNKDDVLFVINEWFFVLMNGAFLWTVFALRPKTRSLIERDAGRPGQREPLMREFLCCTYI
ncbi:UNVERIFIED_CONTAM: hypothetical protein PYX00_011406 [Menopon gallinae]|uniref:Uncharacterized protein n=1 Tax=Menopon gallinae TaxID=328185 RepID=A0AAW2H7R6_9NEOP